MSTNLYANLTTPPPNSNEKDENAWGPLTTTKLTHTQSEPARHKNADAPYDKNSFRNEEQEHRGDSGVRYPSVPTSAPSRRQGGFPPSRSRNDNFPSSTRSEPQFNFPRSSDRTQRYPPSPNERQYPPDRKRPPPDRRYPPSPDQRQHRYPPSPDNRYPPSPDQPQHRYPPSPDNRYPPSTDQRYPSDRRYARSPDRQLAPGRSDRQLAPGRYPPSPGHDKRYPPPPRHHIQYPEVLSAKQIQSDQELIQLSREKTSALLDQVIPSRRKEQQQRPPAKRGSHSSRLNSKDTELLQNSLVERNTMQRPPAEIRRGPAYNNPSAPAGKPSKIPPGFAHQAGPARGRGRRRQGSPQMHPQQNDSRRPHQQQGEAPNRPQRANPDPHPRHRDEQVRIHSRKKKPPLATGPYSEIRNRRGIKAPPHQPSLIEQPPRQPRAPVPPRYQNKKDSQGPLDMTHLPVYAQKQEFLDALETNQVILVSGVSGAGKSTQIPKWLLDTPWGQDKKMQMVCVQPRRIAAISLATRVCEELDEVVGDRVGFKVRFEELCSGMTKMKFVTDGILVFEACSDILLQNYSCIILDEAHERSIFNDILFGICSGIIPRRPNFRLILMSATLDVSQFKSYFKNQTPYEIAVNVNVHPVKHYFRETPLKNREKSDTYVSEIFELVKTIEKQSRSGDILVFLPGAADITTCVTRCENRFRRNWIPIPLYASIEDEEQQRIYKKPPRGKRKIIFATNIAETSITVPGVVFVIDTGLEKRGAYDPKSKSQILVVDNISKTSATQRAGRAGRVQPGIVYCSYTAKELNDFKEKPRANILNAQIDMICLLILHIGFRSLDDFPWLERPSDSHLDHATETLIYLKAIRKESGVLTVTQLGHQMARFPLQPRHSKALVIAKEFSCVEWMASLVAMLTCGGHGVFTRPRQFKKQADDRKKKLCNDIGDHFTLVDLLEMFRDNDESEEWCRENFLRNRVLSESAKVREELISIATQCGWINEETEEQPNPRVRLHCLVSAFPSNLATKFEETDKGWSQYRCLNGSEAFLHPASTLSMCKVEGMNDFVVYHEQYSTARDWISVVSRIPETIYDEFSLKHYAKITSEAAESQPVAAASTEEQPV